MTRHAWLPHPARTIPAPAACPAGTRYTSHTLAYAALLHGLGNHQLDTAPCQLGCGGWHHQPRSSA